MAYIVGIRTCKPDHVFTSTSLEEIEKKYASEKNHEAISKIYQSHPDLTKSLALSSDQIVELQTEKVDKRMDLGISLATRYVTETVTQLVESCKVKISDIGHIVVVTNVLLRAPGIDLELINALNINKDVDRTNINMVGCAAGIMALNASYNHCRLYNSLNLIVCVEFNSVHWKPSSNRADTITNFLFGDGIAAVLVNNNTNVSMTKDHKYLEISQHVSYMSSRTSNGIRLLVGETVRVVLDKELPTLLSIILKEWAVLFQKKTNVDPNEVDFWIIHPGGTRIIDAVTSSFNVPVIDSDIARRIFTENANITSCGIFYVLEQKLKCINRGVGIALSFAPGVAVDSVLLNFGADVVDNATSL